MSQPANRQRPWDEAYDEDGEPRPHYAALLEALAEPAGVAAEVKRRLSARGVSFGAAPDGVFALDPVPRILTEPEWSELQAGVVQRLRALEALVADVYGDGRVFEAACSRARASPTLRRRCSSEGSATRRSRPFAR